jgi:uncharacterized protein (TIGR03437 family)
MAMSPHLRAFTCVLLAASGLPAQPDRIHSRVDRSRTVTLSGHVPAHAAARFDEGPVSSSFALRGITLFLKRSASQQADLDRLLVAQRNPASPDFHRWLTPEEYADRFGLSPSDIALIGQWLQAEGLGVDRVARGRTWITVSGSAARVEHAFGTSIHRYRTGGEPHHANAADPSIPAALGDIVDAIAGLDDFYPQSSALRMLPKTNMSDGSHALAPDDLATIYNLKPLYQAGLDGAGQKIAIVGNAVPSLADVRIFRSRFNLPAQDPQQILVPDNPAPTSQTGLLEANIDLEWAGAVARNASLVYVYSANVFAAFRYAIDQNLAPVLSTSFGICEARSLTALAAYQAMVQQANSQGITVVSASGDSGAAGCDDPGSIVAQNGKSVNFPANIPEVTAIGGTQFDEQGGNYWNSSNDSNGASARSYIPERAWNGVTATEQLWASAGGASGFFQRPSWQTGSGVPADGYRHVPDIALAASFDHDGYLLITGGAVARAGGSSAGAPVFAGMVALLNQSLKQTGLGNINPILYRLAQDSPGVFHDITVGNTNVPCAAALPDCTTGVFGFDAGPGYDHATGLGSPDAYNLISKWTSAPVTGSLVVPSVDNNPVFQQAPNSAGQKWIYTLTLNEEAGVGTTLTDFSVNGSSVAANIPSFFGSPSIPSYGRIKATLAYTTLNVPVTIVFGFKGADADGRQWSAQLPVTFRDAAPSPALAGVSNAASGKQVYAPGMIMSIYGTKLGFLTQAAASVPLTSYMGGFSATVNGVAAPLYFVSPGQVNVQIPYETAVGQATLSVTNGFDIASYKFTVTAAAPGIFMDANGATVPYPRGARGDVLILFITGEGLVSPSLATGASPAAGTPVSQLPAPKLDVKLSIGGVDAPILFAGIPTGLVGVTQVNFQVPAAAPTGLQPLVVTVGGVASAAANFTVTQ